LLNVELNLHSVSKFYGAIMAPEVMVLSVGIREKRVSLLEPKHSLSEYKTMIRHNVEKS
jgi:hypothetical protein